MAILTCVIYFLWISISHKKTNEIRNIHTGEIRTIVSYEKINLEVPNDYGLGKVVFIFDNGSRWNEKFMKHWKFNQ